MQQRVLSVKRFSFCFFKAINLVKYRLYYFVKPRLKSVNSKFQLNRKKFSQRRAFLFYKNIRSSMFPFFKGIIIKKMGDVQVLNYSNYTVGLVFAENYNKQLFCLDSIEMEGVNLTVANDVHLRIKKDSIACRCLTVKINAKRYVVNVLKIILIANNFSIVKRICKALFSRKN